MLLFRDIDRYHKAIARLMEAPRDLADSVVVHCRYSDKIAQGTERHRREFAAYLGELPDVTDVALEWWEETLAARKLEFGDTPETIHRAWLDRPAGPASFPGLVALVRDFWLVCDEVNRAVPEEVRVPPEQFLLAWIIDNRGYENAVEVLACMPYWPIGLDREGNWV
jgi:hypothetical protein